VEFEEESSRFDLELHCWDYPDRIRGRLVYSTDRYEAASIERLVGHWQTLLTSALANPDLPVSSLELLSQSERQALLSQSERRIPTLDDEAVAEKDLVCLFDTQSRLTPNAPAIVGVGVGVSYAEVQQRSEQLAERLVERGIAAGMRVGLLAEPSANAVAAMLALWRVGAVVAPLDSDFPAELVQAYARRAEFSTVVRQDSCTFRCHGSGFTVLSLEQEMSGAQAVASEPVGSIHSGKTLPARSPQSAAWVSFDLDGSRTFTLADLAEAARQMQAAFPLGDGEALLTRLTLCEPNAVGVLFWPLLSGACIQFLSEPLTPKTEANDAGRLPTTWPAPSAIRLSARDWASVIESPAIGADIPPRRLIVSGGLVAPQFLARLSRIHSATAWYLHVSPDMAGFVSRFRHSGDGTEEGAIVAGEPFGSVCRSEDNRQRLCPVGIWGWLAIGLPGTPGVESTGERARWTNAGYLEIDLTSSESVVVEGLKINLRGLEALLLDSGLMHDCVAIPRIAETGTLQVVLYLVAQGRFSPDLVRSYLQQKLPLRFNPVCVPVSAIPLTRSGKPDYEALLGLPIIEQSTIRRCEDALRVLPAYEDAVVITRPRRETIPLVHLSDVLGQSGGTEEFASSEKLATAGKRFPLVAADSNRVASERHGIPLVVASDAPRTLPEALARAASMGNSLVFLGEDLVETKLSYAELQREAGKVLCGLRARGLRPGDKVLFQCVDNLEFIVAFWACHLGGFVPVPLQVAPMYDQANLAVSKLTQALQLLGGPAIVCSASAYGDLSAALRGLNLASLPRVYSMDDLRQFPAETRHEAREAEAPALLLLTSGSTGTPKCVMHSHSSLLAYCAAAGQHNGFQSADISFNWMPLEHVGGIVMFHLRDVYSACTQIHSSTQTILQSPLTWLDVIDRYRVSLTWAPNFAFGLLNDRASEMAGRRWDLSCLRFILNGGEAIIPRVAKKTLENLMTFGLPATAMHPAWGMSETSSGVVYSERFRMETAQDEDPVTEVGEPVPGFAFRIVDDQDCVVSEGSEGRLQVTGPSVTCGYLDGRGVNREAFTDDGWFNTGDLGMVCEGRLSITGRAKDVIMINGANYYCHEIEAVVEEIERVEPSFTAACAVRKTESTTESLAIFFHPRDGRALKDASLLNEIRGRITRRLGISPEYLIPIEKEDVPKTAIGKIQRAALKQRFESAKFQDALRQVDLLLGSPNTLPGWFYAPVWKRKDLRIGRGERELARDVRNVIAFVDDAALMAEIMREFDGASLRQIVSGPDRSNGAGDVCAIRLDAPEDYYDVVKASMQGWTGSIDIIHAWTVGKPQGLREGGFERGLHSLLHLCQAMRRANSASATWRLTVISSDAQSADLRDAIDPDKAALLGLLRTMPHELSWLRVKHVDTDRLTIEGSPASLVREIKAWDGECEVVYRSGVRRVRRFERIDFHQIDRKPSVLIEDGGVYLVTGGLGGIGEVLSTYLLGQKRCRLILTGRTALSELPPAKQGRWDRLRKMGEAVYVSSELSAAALEQAVRKAEVKWSAPLRGVFHLAGIFEEKQLADLTVADLQRVLAAKVEGARAINQLAQERPSCCCIYFSSANGSLGGSNAGAYSAANAFLDGFATFQRQNGVPSRSLAWSMWDEIGMSEGYQLRELSRARGYEAIGQKEGLQSMLAALTIDRDQIIIGIDGSNPNIRPLVDAPACNAEEAIGYVKLAGSEAAANPASQMDFRDGYGGTLPVSISILESPQLTPSGKLDRNALTALSQVLGRSNAEKVQPRNDIERTLVSIWQEVLERDSIGVEDNFFDLGGHSIRLAQVFSRVREEIPACGSITMVDLFKYPTIRSFISYVGGASEANQDAGQSRAAIRKNAMGRQAARAHARDK